MALDFSGSIILGNDPMVLGCTALRFQKLRLNGSRLYVSGARGPVSGRVLIFKF